MIHPGLEVAARRRRDRLIHPARAAVLARRSHVCSNEAARRPATKTGELPRGNSTGFVWAVVVEDDGASSGGVALRAPGRTTHPRCALAQLPTGTACQAERGLGGVPVDSAQREGRASAWHGPCIRYSPSLCSSTQADGTGAEVNDPGVRQRAGVHARTPAEEHEADEAAAGRISTSCLLHHEEVDHFAAAEWITVSPPPKGPRRRDGASFCACRCRRRTRSSREARRPPAGATTSSSTTSRRTRWHERRSLCGRPLPAGIGMGAGGQAPP